MLLRLLPKCLCLAAGLSVLACGAASTAGAEEPGGDPNAPVAVVELFTSQGCPNCPAADELLKEYSARPGIVALSLSVDVWDYLGWRDTLATPKLSQRQRVYSKAMAGGKVYTPQVVVNGTAHVKGGDRVEIDRAIASASLRQPGAPAVRLRAEGSYVVIDVAGAAAGSPPQPATVWLAVIQRSVSVAVRKGDNGGRTLTYTNAVRDLIPVGNWTGAPLTVRLQQAALARPGADACAVLVQQGTEGRIIGAAAPASC